MLSTMPGSMYGSPFGWPHGKPPLHEQHFHGHSGYLVDYRG